MELMRHQEEAVKRLGNGRVLYGGVGSGKGITALAYYVANEAPKNIVVITTARKRDSLDWMREAALFGIGTEVGATVHGTITVDSWNNISKHLETTDAFFIFDEQRLVGTGVWVKSFLKIARRNRWILLTATPGDTWLDYAPIFIANGWYKNITDFKRQHVLYEPYVRYPKVKGYIAAQRLARLRNEVLVDMPFARHTTRIVNWMDVSYDEAVYQKTLKERWDIFKDEPCVDAGALFRVLRRINNVHPSRLEIIKSLLTPHPKLIVFYNFNYELEELRTLGDIVDVYEYNGHRKDPVPEGERWVYLVQYTAGAEAWNCITTNATVFYSLNYSFKVFEQSQGRIDRLNTPFTELFYYVLMSNSGVDRAIKDSLDRKETFNESRWVDSVGGIDGLA